MKRKTALGQIKREIKKYIVEGYEKVSKNSFLIKKDVFNPKLFYDALCALAESKIIKKASFVTYYAEPYDKNKITEQIPYSVLKWKGHALKITALDQVNISLKSKGFYASIVMHVNGIKIDTTFPSIELFKRDDNLNLEEKISVLY
ncbi:MAG: hypothetical protein QXP53_01595 [Candidatus Pacearchaeota archaeon]